MYPSTLTIACTNPSLTITNYKMYLWYSLLPLLSLPLPTTMCSLLPPLVTFAHVPSQTTTGIEEQLDASELLLMETGSITSKLNEQGTVQEGLGRLPTRIPSVSSLLLFNSRYRGSAGVARGGERVGNTKK